MFGRLLLYNMYLEKVISIYYSRKMHKRFTKTILLDRKITLDGIFHYNDQVLPLWFAFINDFIAVSLMSISLISFIAGDPRSIPLVILAFDCSAPSPRMS